MPFESVLDAVDWNPVATLEKSRDGIPHATHEGILRIGGASIRVFQLNTGERVILPEDIRKFLEL